MKQHRPIIIWLLSGCALIFAMVVIGGITRLTHSGLSIVDWHFFKGAIPPFTPADWEDLFRQYQKTPEFNQINRHYGVEEFKSIFWWEYIHRLLGRLIGLVFIIPFALFLLKKRIGRKLLGSLLLIFGLGALQGFIGWYMVKSGLVNEPRVSHYRLALHLCTALLTYSYILWVTLGLLYKGRIRANTHHPLKSMAIALAALVCIQIVYGAFVAGLRAGHIFNTFPLMNGNFMPPAAIALQPLWRNFVDNPSAVQFVHRCLGWLILLAGIVLFTSGRWRMRVRAQSLALRAVFYLILLQFTLGFLTLLLNVALLPAVLHQASAILLLTALLILIRTLQFGDADEQL